MVNNTQEYPARQHKRFRQLVRDSLLALLCSTPSPRAPFQTLYEWNNTPHRQIPIDPSWEKRLQDWFGLCNEMTQDAYVLRIPGISVLDGRSGFAASRLRVIRESMPYDSDARLPYPMLPVRSILPSGRTIIEHALSLRDPYELNYFHFFNDVLGKLLLVREQSPAIVCKTAIISRALNDQPWFQRIMRMPLLRGLRWHIQEPHEYLVCRDLVVAKSPPHHKPYIDRIVDCAHSLVAGRTSSHGSRLLLLRETGVCNQRIPSNQAALRERLAPLGFEALDPAALPWEEQVLALRDCRVLVGVHGAGMTNLMFRGRNPLAVVEIFPPAKTPPHYYWLATLLGYRYVPVVAPENFVVNLDAVVDAIETCGRQ